MTSDNRTEAEKKEAQDRFDSYNPFREGESYTFTVKAIDTKILWDWVGKNIYAAKEHHDLPGGDLLSVSWDNPKLRLDEILVFMKETLKKNGIHNL